MKLRVWVTNGLVGCKQERLVELDPDDYPGIEANEDALEDLAREEMFEMIEWSYEVLSD